MLSSKSVNFSTGNVGLFGNGGFVSYILFRYLYRPKEAQLEVFSDVKVGGFIDKRMSEGIFEVVFQIFFKFSILGGLTA